MPNKSKILVFTSVLFMSALCVNAAQNQILSTGVRKVSDNTVNFTFYTSGENSDKPIVKSKGNNEYTILLPNLSDNTSRAMNIGATNGLVTSADVKTINEGAVTYTKINVKTAKPLTINAETRKTSQTESDLSNLNSIVSKVNLINQDIKNTSNIPAGTTQVKAVEQPIVKASTVKDIIRQNSASVPKRSSIQEAVAVNNVSSHTPTLNKSEKTDISKQKSENIKNFKPVSNVSKTVTSPVQSKQEPQKAETPADIAIANTAAVDEDVAIIPENTVQNTVNEESIPVKNNKLSIFATLKEILFSPFTTIVMLTCLLLAIFALLFKKLTSNLSVTQSINDSFVEKLNGILNRPKEKDFSKIVNDETMSWQEKYRAFNETSNKVNTTEQKKIDGNYVLELSNDKVEEPTVSKVKNDNSQKLKSYKLKSFNNQSVSKQSVREKLDDIMEDEVKPTNNQSVVTNSLKSSPIDNMRIILNRSIDSNKEFYIVSDNGEYSLLGRVKNRLMILKHFGRYAPQDLQVLRGQGNAFIIKAGNYRTQVNVSDSDMNIYSNV